MNITYPYLNRENWPAFRFFTVVVAFFTFPLMVLAQTEIAFVSDTQAPMNVEKIFLTSNQNEKATGFIFHDLLTRKPTALFILGDVVSLGYKEKKWNNMDRYLDSCRKSGIRVSALLGNHDVMTKAKKGEHQFQKRFPDQERLGSYQVVDSVAIILLNSNFTKLSMEDREKQKSWYQATLQNLDRDPGILSSIVTCHHAPYTNSKTVGPSDGVQKYFVPDFLKSMKAKLFITGHSHNYEHFVMNGKDFLVIGGGGGLSQPRRTPETYKDIAADFKPAFHYLLLNRINKKLVLTSRFLKKDFSGFDTGKTFSIPVQ